MTQQIEIESEKVLSQRPLDISEDKKQALREFVSAAEVLKAAVQKARNAGLTVKMGLIEVKLDNPPLIVARIEPSN